MPDKPHGAIENGRELIRRLESHYDFCDEGCGLRNCRDWLELKRHFEFLAHWITDKAP